MIWLAGGLIRRSHQSSIIIGSFITDQLVSTILSGYYCDAIPSLIGQSQGNGGQSGSSEEFTAELTWKCVCVCGGGGSVGDK